MWWNKKYGKEAICSISQSRLRPGKNKEGEPYCVYLPCKHGFYRIPLIEWVKNGKETCPTCRTPFDPIILFLKK